MMSEIMVPVDPKCIPDGYEALGFRIGKAGEATVWYDPDGNALPGPLSYDSFTPAMIIRKKYDPGIKIKQGWWVWNDGEDWVASKNPGGWEDGICGIQHLPDFIPTPDGQPRQIT